MTRPEIDEPFDANADYGYSPLEWQTVVRNLKAIGIDVTIPVSYVIPGVDPQPATHPLGDVLQELAGYFGVVARLGDQRPTPKRHAQDVKKLLVTLRAAAAGLEDHYAAGNAALYGRMLTASELLRGLSPDLERQQREVDKLAAVKDGRSETTVATHTRYWRALVWLWWTIPVDINRQHKNLIDFLMICSAPIFMAATTSTAVANWVAHNFTGDQIAK